MATENAQPPIDQAKSPASAYLHALKVPATFLLVGMCLIAAYYSLYVSNSFEYLKGRDLRSLLTLGSEIQATLDGHQTVLSSFVFDYNVRGASDLVGCIPQNPVAKSIPMFAYIAADSLPDAIRTSSSCSEEPPGQVDTARQQTVVGQARFIDDAGTAWTRRTGAVARANGATVVGFRVGLRQLLEPVFNHQLGDDAFDLLLLVTPSGRVIYANGPSDVRLTSLDSMVRRDLEGKWKKQSFAGLGRSSQVLDVQISDEEYVLYLQPCCIRIQDASSDKTDPGWVVAGLTKRSTLRNDSLAVSFSIMALTGGLLLLAVFSWPFLKLALIGRDRRLRLLDVLAVGICSLLGVALVVLFVADWYSYGRLKDDLDAQLQQLSSDIQRNVGEEINTAYQQLKILDRWSASAAPQERTGGLLEKLGQGEPRRVTYPFIDSFALIDSTGWQRNKWATPAVTTPFVRTQYRQYFKHWQNQVPRAQTVRGASAADASVYPNAFLESLRSATTGRKEAVLSAPIDSTTTDRRTRGITIAALTIPMRSLNDVALPPGFKFAVIDSSGHVLFHSDPQRSLVEQFFLETDRNRHLRAAIGARHSEALSVRYLGRDFRAYVAPLSGINGSEWSLVTLFDRQLLRTVNIEWVITTMLFTVIYASLYIALCIVIHFSRPRYRAPWVWPDSGKQKAYQRLIAAYCMFGIAFIVAMLGVQGQQLLAIAWTLPFIVWITTYLTVTIESVAKPRWRMTAGLLGLMLLILLSSEGWQGILVWGIAAVGVLLPLVPVESARIRQPYITAATLLLVLTAALPTLAAFVVAHAIQVDSYVKYGQLSLAKQIQDDGLPSAGPTAQIEARRRALDRRWGTYGHFFYSSEVVDTTEPEAIVDKCGLRPDVKEKDPRHEFPKLLEDMLPFYSESSVGMRELLHDHSSDNAWDWHRRDAALVLHAQPTAGWNVACIGSQLPTFAAGSLAGIGDPGTVAQVAVLILLAMFVVGWVARFVARRIFLIDVIEPLWVPRAAPLPVHPGEHLYIVWQSADRNARTLIEDGMHVVDLEKVAVSGADGLAVERDRLERLPTGRTVVIDHMEARNGSQAFDDSKFEFVRDALDVQHRTVVIVSGVRPRSLVARITAASSAESATIEQRWTTLLRRFTVLDGVRFNRTADMDPDTVERSVFSEVDVLAREREDESRTPLRREQILEEVGDRLDNYNRGIWESCSDHEKLVLLHVANEGLVNEKNRRTVRQLLARGLIRKNPNFRFANETFQRFVLSRIATAEVAEMEDKSVSPWDSVRLPFLITLLAVSAFFFLTQRELFTTTVAVITALAGGIPSLLRVVGMFERKPDATRPV